MDHEFSVGEAKATCPHQIALSNLIARFLAKQASKCTKRAYRSDLKIFFEELQIQDPREVLPDHIISYRNRLSESLKPATVARRLTVIRQFFDFCVDLDLLPRNPAKKVKPPRVNHSSTTNGLTREEAEELLRQPDRSTLMGKRDFAVLFLMINNGLRRSEVAAIRWGDFGEERGHTILTIRGKGGQEEITKIKSSVMEAIEEYKEASGRRFGRDTPLFITSRTKVGDAGKRAEEPLSPETIRVMVKRYAELAKIKKRVSPHSLRHTCITLSLDGGASIRQAQYLARHGDPKTTMRYDSNRGNLDDHGTDYIHLSP